MSWSVSKTGTPDEILAHLDAQKLIGQSGEEYEAAKPHLVALIKQNYRVEGDQPNLELNAYGSGSTNGKETQRSCSVSLRVAALLIGLLFAVPAAKADTFVDGVRYESGQSVQYVSAAACADAPQAAGACSSAPQAGACSSASSASAGRVQPVRRVLMFVRSHLPRLRGAGGCR